MRTKKSIYKFPIKIADVQDIEVPLSSRPIHVGLDPVGNPCIWCEVYPEILNRRKLHVFVIGTGNPIPDRAETHLGSFVQGSFMWHVYFNFDSSPIPQ